MGLVVLGAAVAVHWSRDLRIGGPVIVLVSIDTLRADALSSFGNPRPISPHLDGLAADGV
jgi:hypothetical protein